MRSHCLHSDLPKEWPLSRSSIYPPSIQTCLLYGNISWISYPGVTLPAAAAAAALAAPKGSQNVQRRHKNVSGAESAVIGPWQPQRRRLPPSCRAPFFSARLLVKPYLCLWALLYNIPSRDLFTLQLWLLTSPPGESKCSPFWVFFFFLSFFFEDVSDLLCLWSMVSAWLWSLTWRSRRVDVYKDF